MTKWGTPVEKWKHNQTPNTTHSLKVVRLFNINENSSLVPVKVNTDKTSLDYILLPCFKSTKPGSPVKAFLFAPLSGALGTSWESSCESDLISRHQRPASLMLLLLNGSKSLLPGSKIQWNAWKNRKLETSDFSRRCSIITSRCCVQVSTALCQNGINVPTHDDLFVSCYISNTLKVTFIPGNVKSLFKKK